MILLNTPPTLRSATLRFHYDHPKLLVRNTMAYRTLTYLDLLLYGSSANASIFSLISIIRIHSTLRHLSVIIKRPTTSGADNTVNVPNLSSINQNDLPILLSLKSFDLQVLTKCDIHSLRLILRCMPNLQEFNLTLFIGLLGRQYFHILLDGNNWQQMVASHVPYLKKFEFHICFFIMPEPMDIDGILNSFQYFVTQFDGWHMAISRWKIYRGVTPYFIRSQSNESNKYFDSLSSLIDLSTIVILEFEQNNDLTRLFIVPHIILACTNVTTLIIGNSLLFPPIVIDNTDLASTFNRINWLEIRADPMYFPLKHALKFVQRFPSLTHLVIEVYSVDSCIPIVDILLGGLPKLHLLIVQFYHDSLLDDPCPREYIIEKRRQSFGLNKNDEYKVNVQIEDQKLLIWTA